MKMKELLEVAEGDNQSEEETRAIKILRKSLKNISDCKKTLKRLENKHSNLLEQEIEDLELDCFEY